MTTTIALEIAGASYRVQADADEAHLRRLAAIVNQRVAALGPKLPQRVSSAHLLAIVALSLADDWLLASDRAKSVEETTRKAIVNAIARIDQRLADGSASEAASPPRELGLSQGA